MSSRKSVKGFTIVELLIVIVVIAILAAISMVAYTGIQQRARNTSIVSSAKSWLNVLTISYSMNGTVDVSVPSGDRGLCLGTADQYPDISDELGLGQCYAFSHTSSQVEEIAAGIGSVNMTTYVVEDELYPFRGIQYWTNEGNEEAHMEYALFGADQDCVLPGADASNDDDTTTCVVTLSDAGSIGGVPFVVRDDL